MKHIGVSGLVNTVPGQTPILRRLAARVSDHPDHHEHLLCQKNETPLPPGHCWFSPSYTLIESLANLFLCQFQGPIPP